MPPMEMLHGTLPLPVESQYTHFGLRRRAAAVTKCYCGVAGITKELLNVKAGIQTIVPTLNKYSAAYADIIVIVSCP